MFQWTSRAKHKAGKTWDPHIRAPESRKETNPDQISMTQRLESHRGDYIFTSSLTWKKKKKKRCIRVSFTASWLSLYFHPQNIHAFVFSMRSQVKELLQVVTKQSAQNEISCFSTLYIMLPAPPTQTQGLATCGSYLTMLIRRERWVNKSLW